MAEPTLAAPTILEWTSLGAAQRQTRVVITYLVGGDTAQTPALLILIILTSALLWLVQGPISSVCSLSCLKVFFTGAALGVKEDTGVQPWWTIMSSFLGIIGAGVKKDVKKMKLTLLVRMEQVLVKSERNLKLPQWRHFLCHPALHPEQLRLQKQPKLLLNRTIQ